MAGKEALNDILQSLDLNQETIQEIISRADAALSDSNLQNVLENALKTEAGQRLDMRLHDTFSEVITGIGAKTTVAAESYMNIPEVTLSADQRNDLQASRNQINEAVTAYTGKDAEALYAASRDMTAANAQAKAPSGGLGEQTPETSNIEEASNADVGSSMLDYINNSSHAELTSSNMTEMDNLVISELAYVPKYTKTEDLAYYKASQRSNITVGEYCQNLLNELEKAMENGQEVNPASYQYLKAMATSERYKNLRLDSARGYANGLIDTQIVSVRLSDGNAIIGVQGTNGTVQDWVNDSAFINTDPTPEELLIRDEIQKLIDNNGYEGVYLTGHSQGGRDAVTAAAFLDDAAKAKLKGIWNLDGPGYSKATLDKYKEQFDSIAPYVHNIYPEDSWVGQLLFSIGDSKYVPTISDGFNLHDHSEYNWVGDSETGGFSEAPTGGIKWLIRNGLDAVIDYICDTVTPEQAEQTLNILFRLGYNEEDPTRLDFGNILKHLDEISVGDAQILLETAATVVLSGVSDFCHTLGNITGAIEKICKVISAVGIFTGPVAAVIATIGEVCGIISTVCKVISVVCDVVVGIIKWISERRAARMKAEREAYLSGNPEVVFYADALLNAAQHLIAANNHIIQADKDCDRIRYGYQESQEDEDGILHWFSKVFNSIRSLFEYLSLAGADLVYLCNQPILKKGASCSNRLAEEGRILLRNVPSASNDVQFTVNPGGLSAFSQSGVKTVADAGKSLDQAMDSFKALGGSWEAEDYESMLVNVTNNIDELKQYNDQLKQAYEMLGGIAGLYSGFQERSVNEFQAAAN